MQIHSLADIALTQMPSTPSGISGDTAIAVLSMQLDAAQEMGADIIQAMEHSVNPDVGGNIDVYV